MNDQLTFPEESDRTLVAGAVMFGRHPLTGRPGVHESPEMFTPTRRATARPCAGWPSWS